MQKTYIGGATLFYCRWKLLQHRFLFGTHILENSTMAETKLKCEVVRLSARVADLNYPTVHADGQNLKLSTSPDEPKEWNQIYDYAPQFIYLVSGRKITVPCVTVETLTDGTLFIMQVDNENDIDNQKRIEATSNHYMSKHAKVPLIPDSFLEKYVESQGGIREVFIEMEEKVKHDDIEITAFGSSGEYYLDRRWTEPKINDNTVIISPVKTSWKLSELRAKCKRAFVYGHDLAKDKPYPLYEDEFIKWFDKNIGNE